ncbi:PLC-like phosphodiesterase [Mycena alexandri]|uniref:PLC-like phosphodiesterase n=1 Tax=Mycena alexandri TaxID=1745969 RepID=A0AAD6T8P5_9AGAR|nr:PLC-like phosphodiesterase [Mycena alexandri]
MSVVRYNPIEEHPNSPTMKLGIFSSLLTTASIVGCVSSQTPIQYIADEVQFTGIVENSHGVTYGFILPNASGVPEFVGQVVAPLENKWVGVALGGPNSLMVVAWQNDSSIYSSPRFVDSQYQATEYDSANISTIDCAVNETHWTWTYRCENCTEWPGGSLDTKGSQEMTWLVGLTEVDTPDMENSTLSQYSALGQWEQNLLESQNDNYTIVLDNYLATTATDWTKAPMFPNGVGQSKAKPALASHLDQLFASGVTSSSTNNLWYAKGNNVAWDQKTTMITETSQDGPALMDFGGTLHLVFPEKTSGKLVHLQYNDNIAAWDRRTIITNATTSRQAALTVFGGALVCAYYDPSDHNRLHVGAWDPQTGWGTFQNLGGETWGTPSLYTDGSDTDIYLLFPANNNGRKILGMTTTRVNGAWISAGAPDESSAFGTSATQFTDQAMMGFQSNNGQGQLMVSFYNGSSWLPHERVNSETTSHTPSLAMLGGTLNCIFSSHNSDNVVLRATRPMLAYPLDSWMKHLNGDLYMSQLSIPGTHDSAAITIVPDTETQTMTISQQLNAGIRFFDLRCILFENELFMAHGFLIQEMYNWFAVNSNHLFEALVVSIKREKPDEFSNIQFDEAVYDRIQSHSATWRIDDTIPTLGQLRGRIQLFRRYSLESNNSAFDIGLDASMWPDNNVSFVIPVTNGTLVIEDHYNYDKVVGFLAVVANKTSIVKSALNAAIADPSPANWHISFSSATNNPDHSPHAFATGGTQRSTIPWVYVPGLNQNLLGFVNPMLLSGGQRPKIGTVLMDFPESPSGGSLIASIIDLNG